MLLLAVTRTKKYINLWREKHIVLYSILCHRWTTNGNITHVMCASSYEHPWPPLGCLTWLNSQVLHVHIWSLERLIHYSKQTKGTHGPTEHSVTLQQTCNNDLIYDQQTYQNAGCVNCIDMGLNVVVLFSLDENPA